VSWLIGVGGLKINKNKCFEKRLHYSMYSVEEVSLGKVYLFVMYSVEEVSLGKVYLFVI
jgi:phosphoribosylformylglycinamidine (FGAM) synthase PurS component